MNGSNSEQNQYPGQATADLATRIKAELLFFESAANRARSWQTAWRDAAHEVREELMSQQAGLLEEILGRDESLQEIHRLWRERQGGMDEVERKRIREAVHRLDEAMQSLLRIEKEALQSTEEVRRELLREIKGVRAAREAHSSYRGRDKPSPRCVDREL